MGISIQQVRVNVRSVIDSLVFRTEAEVFDKTGRCRRGLTLSGALPWLFTIYLDKRRFSSQLLAARLVLREGTHACGMLRRSRSSK